MSNTPETDAKTFIHEWGSGDCSDAVDATLSKRLERERDEARAVIEDVREWVKYAEDRAKALTSDAGRRQLERETRNRLLTKSGVFLHLATEVEKISREND